jgi:hypothetical protein
MEGLLGSPAALLMVGTGLFALSCVILWLPLAALRVGAHWAAGILLIPFASVLFAILHWDVAERPIKTGLLALSISVCIFLVRAAGYALSASL